MDFVPRGPDGAGLGGVGEHSRGLGGREQDELVDVVGEGAVEAVRISARVDGAGKVFVESLDCRSDTGG